MTSSGETASPVAPAAPIAVRIWAPYGSMPCTMQLALSRMLALRAAGMPYRFEISRAMGPVMTIATVLLAVKQFTTPTRRKMPNSPPRRPRMCVSMVLSR